MSESLMDAYYKRWIVRARRELTVGDRMTELAHLLAAVEGVRTEEIRSEIQSILGGYEMPTTDFVAKVENYLLTLRRTTRRKLEQAV